MSPVRFMSNFHSACVHSTALSVRLMNTGHGIADVMFLKHSKHSTGILRENTAKNIKVLQLKGEY